MALRRKVPTLRIRRQLWAHYSNSPLSPPAHPPEVWIEGVAIEPLSFEWFDSRTEQMVTLYPDEGALAAVPVVGSRSVARASIASQVGLLRFDVQQFLEVDASGVPLGEPTITECKAPASSCDILETDTGLEVRFPLEPGVVFATISLSYALLSDSEKASQQGFGEDYVSYGFYVGGK